MCVVIVLNGTTVVNQTCDERGCAEHWFIIIIIITIIIITATALLADYVTTGNGKMASTAAYNI